jgi:acyl-CoA thioester hydrolase
MKKVSETRITYRGVVYPWQCDHMGHMNVMWYTSKFDEATWNVFSTLGITTTYIREQKCGIAGVQQNIAYKMELAPGDPLVVRTRVLEVRPRVIRILHEMSKEESGELAATSELTVVHISLITRKACPYPKAVQKKARSLQRRV